MTLSATLPRTLSATPARARYRTRIVDSLAAFSDEDLDRVTASAGIFLDRRWFRLLDAVDLSELCRGEVRLRYALADSDDGLAAICPFLVTRSQSVVYQYSLEKLYFTSWQAQLARMNPASVAWSGWLARVTDGYRRAARMLGTGCEGWLLATSPLSFRGGVACRELPDTERDGAYDAILVALQDEARREGLPLCMNAVEEASPLRAALARRNFAETFFMFDNGLDLGIQRFDEYLARFPGKVRRKFTYEMRDAAKLGYRFDVRHDHSAIASEMATSYEATYGKYGDEFFLHPASFWAALERTVGENAQAVVADLDGTAAGFAMLLHKGDELFVYRLGRFPEANGDEPPIYFSLLLYEPIKRAIELGAKKIWLSGGAWEGKRRRGARGFPLYSYFWFPTRSGRFVLAPFIDAFSRINLAQVSRVVAA